MEWVALRLGNAPRSDVGPHRNAVESHNWAMDSFMRSIFMVDLDLALMACRG